jgi:hypothetical protein
MPFSWYVLVPASPTLSHNAQSTDHYHYSSSSSSLSSSSSYHHFFDFTRNLFACTASLSLSLSLCLVIKNKNQLPVAPTLSSLFSLSLSLSLYTQFNSNFVLTISFPLLFLSPPSPRTETHHFFISNNICSSIVANGFCPLSISLSLALFLSNHFRSAM